MKRILIVNNNMHIGGVQKALVSLLNEIRDQYDITLFLFAPVGPLLEHIPEGVKVVTCKSLYKYFGISQAEAKHRGISCFVRSVLAIVTRLFGRRISLWLASLTQKTLTQQFDVAVSFLHEGAPKSFYGGCNHFVLYKVNATKKVTFLHGDFLKCGADHRAICSLYRKFDCIAACSAGCRERFISRMPDMAKHCAVVPNCHSYERMKNQSQQDTVRYEKNMVHVLTIARLSKEKGVDRAIRAVAHVKAAGGRICYHIVGDGIERNALEALRDDLGLGNAVFFYGNQENPYRFIPNADLLLLPSYHEAAPLVVDEARCLGVPVLSTRTISAEEMIVKRDLGWVCDNSQEAIENALAELTMSCIVLTKKKNIIAQQECSNQDAVFAFCNIVG